MQHATKDHKGIFTFLVSRILLNISAVPSITVLCIRSVLSYPYSDFLNPFVKPFQYRPKGHDYYWSHGTDVSTFLVDQMLLFLASSLGISLLSLFLFRYSNILWYCYINDFTYFPFFPLLQSHCLVLLLRRYGHIACESHAAPYPYPIL